MDEPKDGTGASREERSAPPRGLGGLFWRPLVGSAVFLAGLYLTFQGATRLIYDAEGYEAGAKDCDDCGLTLLLDNIGWLALAIGAYLLLACLALLTLRRLGMKRHSA
jgi:hypothetical protein